MKIKCLDFKKVVYLLKYKDKKGFQCFYVNFPTLWCKISDLIDKCPLAYFKSNNNKYIFYNNDKYIASFNKNNILLDPKGFVVYLGEILNSCSEYSDITIRVLNNGKRLV